MTGSPPSARPSSSREPATPSTLVAWRRTGLLTTVVGLGSGLAALALALGSDSGGGVAGGLGLVAVLCLLIGLGFLQRTWSDPLVAADPQVVVIRRWAGAASAGWGLGLLVRLAARALPDGLEWLRWVGSALGVGGVVAYLVVLALVTRWSPARA